jgi:signal transduction histidine kinase
VTPSRDPEALAAELTRRDAELAALDAIGRLAARSPDPAAFLDETARIVEERTGCAGAAVYVLDDAGRALVLVHQRGLPTEIAARVARAPVKAPAIFTTSQSDADVVPTSIYPEPFQVVFEATGIRTEARVPLVVGSRIVGVFAVGFRDPETSHAAVHLRFLRAVGALVAAVIESDRNLGDLRRRVAELTLLNDLAVASAQLNPVLLLDGALRRIADVLGCAMGAAFVREGESLENVALFGVRPEAAPAARSIPVGRGPCGDAVQRREVLAWSDPEELGGPFAENMRGEGIHGVVGVPLLTKEEPVGGLVLGRRTERPFAPEELRFLHALGSQLGVAVENARLYAAARRQVAHLEAVRALAHRVFMTPAGDADALLADGCRETARALDARAWAAYLVSPDGETLRYRAGQPWPGDTPPPVVPVDGDGLASEAVRRGLPAQSSDCSRDPRCALRETAITPLSLLAIPIASRDVARAVLFVADAPGRVFGAQEVALARAMSAALGVGLESAGLAVDLDRSHAALEQAQAQLVLRERLAALGALSAAVAHEVRNPLGVVFNSIGMLRRHRALDDEARTLVNIVGEEAERLNRIVTDLLGFARPPAASLRRAPLGPIVEEAVRAALAGKPVPVETSLELSPDLPAVAVDAGLIRQAVINVVQNAVQAMPRGGRLRVRTGTTGPFAEIEVTDSGPGIPTELRARIFEPFFTTRTSGTGLGLSIVKHVIEAHGGEVEAGAGAGGGARFALRLPLGTSPVVR